jgi:hypothetical protein
MSYAPDGLKHRLFNYTVLALAAVAAVACFAFFSLTGSGSDMSSADGPGLELDAGSPPVVMAVSGLYQAYTIEELIDRSHIVVVGRILGQSEPFLVKPVGIADPRYFTDTFVAVKEVLYGDQGRLGSTIAIRTLGGAGESFAVYSDDKPDMASGEAFVFFLYQENYGVNWNTEGDHFYILGGKQGCFPEAGQGVFTSNVSLSSNSLETANRTYSADELRNLVALVGRSQPLSADDYRQEALDMLTGSYERGEIGQEKYDFEMTMYEQFARIMTEEEVQEYEEKMTGIYVSISS